MSRLFSVIPTVTPQNQEISSIDLTPISTAISAQPVKKKARHPRLQRQIVVYETQNM